MRSRGTRLWYVDGARYSFALCYQDAGARWRIPSLHAVGTFGVDLFSQQSTAIKLAEANLRRMAEEEGLTPAEMERKLRAGVAS